MEEKTGDQAATFAILLLASFILPVVAFIGWDQALDFDPCDNVFKHAGTKCLTSPAGFGIGGALIALFGGSICHGAVTKGRHVLGNWTNAGMMAWIGLSIAAMGGAMVYAAYYMRDHPAVEQANADGRS